MSAYNSFSDAVESAFTTSILPIVIQYYEEKHGITEQPRNLLEYMKVNKTAGKTATKAVSTKTPLSKEEMEETEKMESENGDLAQGMCIYFSRSKFCGGEVEGDQLFCAKCRQTKPKTVRKNLPSFREKLDENGGEIPSDLIKGTKASKPAASKSKATPATNTTTSKIRTETSGKKFKSVNKKSLSAGPASRASKSNSVITPSANFKYNSTLDAYVSDSRKLVATKENGKYIVVGAYDPSTGDEFDINESTIREAKKLGLEVDDTEEDDIGKSNDDPLAYSDNEEETE